MYTLEDYIERFLSDYQHWHEDVVNYDKHLYQVLQKAFGINLEGLLQEPEYYFLKELKVKYNQIRTPTTGFLEASLAYSKFPVLDEIHSSFHKQMRLIKDIFLKVVIHFFGEQANKTFSKQDIISYGYDQSLEPNYGKIFDDY